jgi:hypothetical protein
MDGAQGGVPPGCELGTGSDRARVGGEWVFDQVVITGGRSGGLKRSQTKPASWASRAIWVRLVAVSADNLCHQAIFVDDATYTVMPPDPEMIQVGDAIWQRP